MDWRSPFIPRLFEGHVSHLRLHPKRHLLRYKVTAAWLDIDDLRAIEARGIAVDRWGPTAFWQRDHGFRTGGALRPWVEAELAKIGATKPDRVMLLSFFRIWGFGFAPISVYFCYDSRGEVQSVVYEVKNTIGGQTGYAAVAIDPHEAYLKRTQHKTFSVSPFIDMAKTYRFQTVPPGERLRFRIRQDAGDTPYLYAVWTGVARALCRTNLYRISLVTPLRGAKIWGAIHWEAIKMRAKGFRLASQTPRSTVEDVLHDAGH